MHHRSALISRNSISRTGWLRRPAGSQSSLPIVAERAHLRRINSNIIEFKSFATAGQTRWLVRTRWRRAHKSRSAYWNATRHDREVRDVSPRWAEAVASRCVTSNPRLIWIQTTIDLWLIRLFCICRRCRRCGLCDQHTQKEHTHTRTHTRTQS